jgi:hypothetical protein
MQEGPVVQVARYGDGPRELRSLVRGLTRKVGESRIMSKITRGKCEGRDAGSTDSLGSRSERKLNGTTWKSSLPYSRLEGGAFCGAPDGIKGADEFDGVVEGAGLFMKGVGAQIVSLLHAFRCGATGENDYG